MIEAELFEIIEEFPENIRPHMVRLVKILARHIDEGIRRSDLERLEAKTEEGFQRVWGAIERLAEAQRRTEDELRRFARHFDIKIGALGARWGYDSEEARGSYGQKRRDNKSFKRLFQKSCPSLQNRYGLPVWFLGRGIPET